MPKEAQDNHVYQAHMDILLQAKNGKRATPLSVYGRAADTLMRMELAGDYTTIGCATPFRYSSFTSTIHTPKLSDLHPHPSDSININIENHEIFHHSRSSFEHLLDRFGPQYFHHPGCRYHLRGRIEQARSPRTPTSRSIPTSYSSWCHCASKAEARTTTNQLFPHL
jgi:hypothetical protein